MSFIFALQSQEELDELFCYYQNNDPTILLKPLEVEIISIDPDIYIFHNFITDSEIEHLKDRSKPLVRSKFDVVAMHATLWCQVMKEWLWNKLYVVKICKLPILEVECKDLHLLSFDPLLGWHFHETIFKLAALGISQFTFGFPCVILYKTKFVTEHWLRQSLFVKQKSFLICNKAFVKIWNAWTDNVNPRLF